jgi:hypothetical protein
MEVTREYIKQHAEELKQVMTPLINEINEQCEDKTLTHYSRAEITVRGVEYSIYLMHGVAMYCTRGGLKMLTEAEWMESLSPDQLSDIAMLGLHPDIEPEEIQNFLDKQCNEY